MPAAQHAAALKHLEQYERENPPRRRPAPPEPLHRGAWLGSATYAAVLLLVGYLTVGGIAADRLTLPERKVVPENNPGKLGVSYTDVSFPARDGKAEDAVWYLRSPTADKAIILVHGRDTSRSDAIQGHWVEATASRAA